MFTSLPSTFIDGPVAASAGVSVPAAVSTPAAAAKTAASRRRNPALLIFPLPPRACGPGRSALRGRRGRRRRRWRTGPRPPQAVADGGTGAADARDVHLAFGPGPQGTSRPGQTGAPKRPRRDYELWTS